MWRRSWGLVECDGEMFRAVASQGYPGELPYRPRAIAASEYARFGALLAGERLIHVLDLMQLDDPTARAVAERGGVRTNLLLPLRGRRPACRQTDHRAPGRRNPRDEGARRQRLLRRLTPTLLLAIPGHLGIGQGMLKSLHPLVGLSATRPRERQRVGHAAALWLTRFAVLALTGIAYTAPSAAELREGHFRIGVLVAVSPSTTPSMAALC